MCPERDGGQRDAEKARGYSTTKRGVEKLTTRIRRMELKDVKVTKEAPPPPTSTIPSFRHRDHRGGESILLQRVFPSGFYPSKAPETPPRPTGKFRRSSPPSSPDKSLISEWKGLGVPRWGAAANRRGVTVTRVVVGAEVIAKAVRNDMIQFDPKFPCDAKEYVSPGRRLGSPSKPSPILPTRMTIDGSSLVSLDQKLVVTSIDERENPWQQPMIENLHPVNLRTCSSGIYRQEGRKRNRAILADANCSCTRACPLEAVNRNSLKPRARPRKTIDKSSSTPCIGGGGKDSLSGGGAGEKELKCAHDSRGDQADIFAKSEGRVSERRIHDKENTGDQPEGQPGILQGSNLGEISKNLGDDEKQGKKRSEELMVLSCEFSSTQHSRDTSINNSSQADQVERGRVDLALMDDASERVGEAWETSADNSISWQGESADSIASGNTLGEMQTSPKPVGYSVKYVSGKQSISTIDTECYVGHLSKNATNIVRCHFESQGTSVENIDSCFSGSRDILAADSSALISPAPPPAPSEQVLDSLLAALPGPGKIVSAETPSLFHFFPIEKSKRCYVRTSGDVILAVVKKKELLKCKNEVGVRKIKEAARLVRIQVGMTLKEGLRAIQASGLLPEEVPDDCGGRAIVLEYFSSQAGTWKAIRRASDWKIMLAAPAGLHRAGIVSGSHRANGCDADFLVTVDSAPQSSKNRLNSAKPLASTRTNASSTFEAAFIRDSKKNDKPTEHRDVLVTPGVLQSLHINREKCADCDGQDNGSSENPNGKKERAIRDKRLTGAYDKRKGQASPISHKAAPESSEGEEESPVESGRRLADLMGGRWRDGPRPNGALWTSRAVRARTNSSCKPRKVKVKRLVKHLEAGLKLKGQPPEGGLPQDTHTQKIDTPYTKELAKWGYDEILGIPRKAVLGRTS